MKLDLYKCRPKLIYKEQETYNQNKIRSIIENSKKINVFVLDSGLPQHSLLPNISDIFNVSNSNTKRDVIGHSTAICSIINNHLQNAEIHCIKTINEFGTGKPQDFVKAIQYSILNHANVICIAAGTKFQYQPLHNIIQIADQNNILIVAAAGNKSETYPALYPEVIAATNKINTKYYISDKDVHACWLNNEFCAISGSSVSCARLSGICAQLLQSHTPKEIKNILANYIAEKDSK